MRKNESNMIYTNTKNLRFGTELVQNNIKKYDY